MKVLLVEDEPSIREVMTDILTGLGCTCTAAEDGLAGLAAFEKGEFEVVFVDVLMPHMDGLELLREIRARNRDVIVIISTAFGSEDHAMRALRLGANDYLKKPVRLPDLAAVVRKYAKIVAGRNAVREMPDYVVHHELRLELPSDPAKAPMMARYLTEVCGGGRPMRGEVDVHLGLTELIINAIEHGNLAISGEQKWDALSEGQEAYDALVASRLSDPEIADRKLRVRVVCRRDVIEWTIEDEGAGFDWSYYMDMPSPPDEEHVHGRGLYLCRYYFDEIRFGSGGREVRARKNVAVAAC